MTEHPITLYREECVAAQSSKSEGEVIIPPNLNMNFFAYFSLALILALIVLLIKGEYTRKARLDGVVMPSTGLVKVVARSEGSVTQLLVREGQRVRASQVLYRLSGEHYDNRGIGTLAAVTLSLTQQYQMLERQRDQEKSANAIQLVSIQHRIEQLMVELNSAETRLKLAQQQALLSNSMMQRYNKLFKEKYIAEAEYQQKQIELSITKENVEEQRQTQLRLARELAATEFELDSVTQQGQSRQAELNRQLQGIHQQKIELDAQEKMTLTAPVDGIISAVIVKVGQTVKQNDPLLTLVPVDAQLQVELYASSKSVGFIKPSQRVGLRFASFPYEKFGVQYGTTREVTRSSLSSGDVMSINPVIWKGDEGHYRVVVDLDETTITAYGRQEPLRVGMTVSADIELDNRYLYEWLLEPLWTLKGKM